MIGKLSKQYKYFFQHGHQTIVNKISYETFVDRFLTWCDGNNMADNTFFPNKKNIEVVALSALRLCLERQYLSGKLVRGCV